MITVRFELKFYILVKANARLQIDQNCFIVSTAHRHIYGNWAVNKTAAAHTLQSVVLCAPHSNERELTFNFRNKIQFITQQNLRETSRSHGEYVGLSCETIATYW